MTPRAWVCLASGVCVVRFVICIFSRIGNVHSVLALQLKARELFIRGLRELPPEVGNSYLYHSLAILCKRMGRTGEARQWFEQVRTTKDNDKDKGVCVTNTGEACAASRSQSQSNLIASKTHRRTPHVPYVPLLPHGREKPLPSPTLAT